jgi:hypothetical protein
MRQLTNMMPLIKLLMSTSKTKTPVNRRNKASKERSFTWKTEKQRERRKALI